MMTVEEFNDVKAAAVDVEMNIPLLEIRSDTRRNTLTTNLKKPGNIMFRQDTAEFIIVDRKLIVSPLDAADSLCIPVGHAKPAAFVIHKTVEAYDP